MKLILSRLNNRVAALGLSVAIILAGTAVAFTQKPKAESLKLPPPDERPVDRTSVGHVSFAPIVKKVGPGVVKISTTTKMHNTGFSGAPSPVMDDFFRRFFGDQFPGFQGRQGVRRNYIPRQEGVGSGVIVTKDGYILTNNHVVDGADELKVSLQDGRDFMAKVIGRDPKSDIAVIKIDGKDLPAVPMADSDKVEVGDVVLAVGNPFGIGQIVTTGIVSATGRAGAIGLDYEDFIQTDAAINPGNSGGALVDAEGRLIGINTAILSRSGGNQGIGFAIPANLARDVMQSLVKDGHVVRGYIGASVQTLTPELAEAMKLKGEPSGALVGEVTPKSPSEKAGMKTGDVITSVNGKKISDARELRLIIGSMAPGSKAQMGVNREGQTKTFDVELAEMPPGTTEEGPETSPEENAQPEKTTVFGGVAVADVTGDVRSALNFPKDIQGAVIEEINDNSPT